MSTRRKHPKSKPSPSVRAERKAVAEKFRIAGVLELRRLSGLELAKYDTTLP